MTILNDRPVKNGTLIRRAHFRRAPRPPIASKLEVSRTFFTLPARAGSIKKSQVALKE
jgi:hypothetical protein